MRVAGGATKQASIVIVSGSISSSSGIRAHSVMYQRLQVIHFSPKRPHRQRRWSDDARGRAAGEGGGYTTEELQGKVGVT